MRAENQEEVQRMRYERMQEARFIERPNRFIAHVNLNGEREIVHVKNTGRCAELLVPGTRVYVQESKNPERKTRWDLIAAEKQGRIINMDSQIPNHVVKEWAEQGNFVKKISKIQSEVTYGNSRFDLYIETKDGRKIFIEVKGVTLEQDGVAKFPDAPSDRAVKHVTELSKALKDGYETYVIFVIQMKGIRYFTPNCQTHLEFGEALREAKNAGVQILAYDCEVEVDEIRLSAQIPVVLGSPLLMETAEPLVEWYKENHRQLPWREHVTAYRVWVSEIMLQQTRVEAVKPYYERFLNALPDVKALAEAPEDELLKLWEGLGYYNRVRNMQKAAQQIVEEYQGNFPGSYEEIRKLSGIGDYTAGAIASFAFGIARPAVDGNVLRVVSRILAYKEDIMKQSVRRHISGLIEEVIPRNEASEFNQGLIELGAVICVPKGKPKCEICPAAFVCEAKARGIQLELPVKKKAKERRIEKRTVLIFKDERGVAIRKRSLKGLLAGLYEFPNVKGHLTEAEVIAYGKSIGLMPVRVRALKEAKHIFSHVEWHMTGYEILVDELEKKCAETMIFAQKEEIDKKYSIPSAFAAYK